MSDQNIIPSAPLYPNLNESEASASDFILKKIRDCQGELENEISHYQQVSEKYKRVNSIAHTSSALTGVTADGVRNIIKRNRRHSRRSSRGYRWITQVYLNRYDRRR